jgi:cytoskeletal protein CcmA (bactofilin family)
VAEVRGRFEGELTARKRLVVFASGKVSGKIRYGKVSIEDGGEIAGDVSSLGSQQSRPAAGPMEAVRPAALQAS